MAVDHQPIEDEYRVKMRALASAIDQIFNEGKKPKELGFALLLFPFGEAPSGRMNYISNAQRSDMLVAVREWLEQAEEHQRELEAAQGET